MSRSRLLLCTCSCFAPLPQKLYASPLIERKLFITKISMTTPAEIEAQKLSSYTQHVDESTPLKPAAVATATEGVDSVTGTVMKDPMNPADQDGGHPQSAYLPPMHDYSACKQLPPDQWHSGMCDCMQDTNSCCEEVWCHYCQMGYQYHKMKTGVMGPDWAICFGTFCADVWITKGHALAFMIWDTRNRIRQRWNIEPEANDLTECFKVFCCPCLAQCQVYREMTYRGYWPGSVCWKDPNPVLLPLASQ